MSTQSAALKCPMEAEMCWLLAENTMAMSRNSPFSAIGNSPTSVCVRPLLVGAKIGASKIALFLVVVFLRKVVLVGLKIEGHVA